MDHLNQKNRQQERNQETEQDSPKAIRQKSKKQNPETDFAVTPRCKPNSTQNETRKREKIPKRRQSAYRVEMNGARRSSPTQNRIERASANPNPPRAKREYPSIPNRRSSDGSEPAGTSIGRSKRSGLPHDAISWIDEVSIELDGNWSELHTRAADSVRERKDPFLPASSVYVRDGEERREAKNGGMRMVPLVLLC
ncbi:hypothetical protein NL676_017964 [Syzygium grande]|nr:hypothetical protein NL676_017964 [Syzygium grande]